MPQTSTTETAGEGKLGRFFDDASAILGEANISRDHQSGALKGPHGQYSYGDPYSPTEDHQPSGAVRPSSVKEVQNVVRLANKHRVALWTISRGKNLGYGGSAPVVKGTVVLDLQRMNKVVEINEEYGYAIVEPGVSFFDLYEEIQQLGLNLWPSVPAIGWGSVLGNTLDRGFGYTPNGEHSQFQCGMEVVLPNGELLRTGSGAMEDNKTFPLYKGGFGPSVDGLFYQSNLGIVTKLGIHITPAPQAYATIEIDVPREEDLVPLVGTLSDLMRRSIILNSPSIANIFRIALTSNLPEVQANLAKYMRPGSCVPYVVLEEIRVQNEWGFWRAYFSLYGSVELLPALLKTTQRAFNTIAGVQIRWKEHRGVEGQYIRASEIGQEEIPHNGIPTLAPLGIVNTRVSEDGGAHTCFSPILPPSGRELYEWYLGAKQRTLEAKFDFFADFHVFPRYIIGIELMIYKLPEEKAAMDLYEELLQDAARQGYMGYRTHVKFMDKVSGKLNFNQSALPRFLATLKNALDPNGIVSPGKSGIWSSSSSSKTSKEGIYAIKYY